MPRPKNTTRIQFYVTNDRYRKLQQQAQAKEVSISTLCKLGLDALEQQDHLLTKARTESNQQWEEEGTDLVFGEDGELVEGEECWDYPGSPYLDEDDDIY